MVLVFLAIVTGGPEAVRGLPAGVAAGGLAVIILLLAALVPWLPHSRSGEIELPLSPEEAFDALTDFQRNARIPRLNRAEIIYRPSGDQLVRDSIRLIMRRAAFTYRRIKAEGPSLIVTNVRAGGQNMTTTRRLSPTASGTRLEVEEAGRLGLVVAIRARLTPHWRWLAELAELARLATEEA